MRSDDGIRIRTRRHPGEPVVPALEVEPCLMVLFGATGDLAERKIFPALYELAALDRLPEQFGLIAFSRSALDEDAFRDRVRAGLGQFARSLPLDEKVWAWLSSRISCVSGSVDDPASFARLRAKIDTLTQQCDTEGNLLHYLATPASGFRPLLEGLAGVGLLERAPRGHDGPWHRLVIEKPFGEDLESARALNQSLWEVLDESQIFRIDHYLGKETVQNLTVFRLANAIFEPLWNRQHIDRVEITAAETLGVAGRGRFYDETGVVRDMVQNHLIQVLSLVAMEPPVSLDAEDIRNEKHKVMRAMRSMLVDEVRQSVVHGQYEGFRQEEGVAPDSLTASYVALKVNVDTWRWQGVPFYVRAGKRLARRVTEVRVHFKTVPFSLFSTSEQCQRLEPNVLTFRIQPQEGISLRMESKVPGDGVELASVTMDFGYASTFKRPIPEAYERLLHDVMRGDATHFARADSVEEAWRYVMPILEAHASGAAGTVHLYRVGSEGPDAAARLLAQEGRRWTPLS
ncbi:MAG TPA: glucose-6-phosphate dehydrogenase [Myxococcaceae bacterium]|nr:glucose-6-phosphate dehydrogenase [Myxococcaceae bacterium]